MFSLWNFRVVLNTSGKMYCRQNFSFFGGKKCTLCHVWSRKGTTDLNLSDAWWRELCGSVLPQGSPKTAESDPKHTSKSKNNSKKSFGCSSQQNCPEHICEAVHDLQRAGHSRQPIILMYISCSCLQDGGCCCLKKEEEKRSAKDESPSCKITQGIVAFSSKFCSLSVTLLSFRLNFIANKCKNPDYFKRLKNFFWQL